MTDLPATASFAQIVDRGIQPLTILSPSVISQVSYFVAAFLLSAMYLSGMTRSIKLCV
jgi:hypothetical protein